MSGPARFRNRVKVSERHGAGEWMAERLSSLILVPFTLWALWAGFSLAGVDYETARAFFARPWNAGLLAVGLVLALWHMDLGIKVIVDDYIHRPASNRALVWTSHLLALALALLGVFFIARLALGSAPLPAGLGL